MKRLAVRRASPVMARPKRRNTADDRFTARPKGATQMIQYGVAVLVKDMPFPADCALSWIIWVALNPSISPWRSTNGLTRWIPRHVCLPSAGDRKAIGKRLTQAGLRFWRRVDRVHEQAVFLLCLAGPGSCSSLHGSHRRACRRFLSPSTEFRCRVARR